MLYIACAHGVIYNLVLTSTTFINLWNTRSDISQGMLYAMKPENYIIKLIHELSEPERVRVGHQRQIISLDRKRR